MTHYHFGGLLLATIVGLFAIHSGSDAGLGLAGSMVSGILGHAQGQRSERKRATDSQKENTEKETEK